jgi:hypothetical protein
MCVVYVPDSPSCTVLSPLAETGVSTGADGAGTHVDADSTGTQDSGLPGQVNYPRAGCCAYELSAPAFYFFELPAVQPHSPGDVQLNTRNPITLVSNGKTTSTSNCNGDQARYYDEQHGVWRSNSLSSGALQHVFYATGDRIMVSALQSSQTGLAVELDGRLVELWLTCGPSNERSCVQFQVGSHANGALFASRNQPATDCSNVPASAQPVYELSFSLTLADNEARALQESNSAAFQWAVVQQIAANTSQPASRFQVISFLAAISNRNRRRLLSAAADLSIVLAIMGSDDAGAPTSAQLAQSLATRSQLQFIAPISSVSTSTSLQVSATPPSVCSDGVIRLDCTFAMVRGLSENGEPLSPPEEQTSRWYNSNVAVGLLLTSGVVILAVVCMAYWEVRRRSLVSPQLTMLVFPSNDGAGPKQPLDTTTLTPLEVEGAEQLQQPSAPSLPMQLSKSAAHFVVDWPGGPVTQSP